MSSPAGIGRRLARRWSTRRGRGTCRGRCAPVIRLGRWCPLAHYHCTRWRAYNLPGIALHGRARTTKRGRRGACANRRIRWSIGNRRQFARSQRGRVCGACQRQSYRNDKQYQNQREKPHTPLHQGSVGPFSHAKLFPRQIYTVTILNALRAVKPFHAHEAKK